MRTKVPVAIEMDHVLRRICDPDLRFPDHISGVLLEGGEVRERGYVDTVRIAVGQHGLKLGVPFR